MLSMITLQFLLGTEQIYEIFVDDEDEDLFRQHEWYLHQGYATRCRKKADGPGPDKIFLHRAIMERKLGKPIRKNQVVDHLDHKRWNCMRDNLRCLTKMENVRHG